MKNRWSDQDARDAIAHYAAKGVNEDLALRVYTSRLIGVEPELVIHGGGNTSVKTTMRDFLGHEREVLCVKGSGWNLDTIEPEGLPAVLLEPILGLRNFETLTDEDMVSYQRSNLLDPNSPNPSVETLLHAFLPHKFVDHSHSTAILAVSDQSQGEAICREIFGDRLAYLHYVAPGFDLSQATANLYEENPAVEGVLLHKHGLFTFGETARESYNRMIDFVSMAEDYVQNTAPFAPPAITTTSTADVADIAPIIRGACSTDLGDGRHHHVVTTFRTSAAIRTFVDGEELTSYGARGVVTPDHVIRTKRQPLITSVPASADLSSFEQEVAAIAQAYRDEYEAYFHRNNQRWNGQKRMLDPSPRVVLVPGVGLFGIGTSKKAANIAADLTEITIDTVSLAERVGTFEALPEEDLFDMEYWSLEQAKLGKSSPKPLAGQVAVITGGGGAIGAATAKLFAENGAEVAILDIESGAADAVAAEIGGHALALACDVTEPDAIKTAFAQVCETFGGIDILVSNAGAAWQGEIATLDDSVLRKSFELNFFAHQNLAQAAVQIMRRQKTGGSLLFNASKQAINPGENFGAYGLPKAATLFLSRQYALEYGKHGIRSNAVNADRIKSGLLTEDMIVERSKARGLSTEEYLAGNLLGREVRAKDVAQAFLHHAVSPRTTGDVTTVDGGNIAAALR
jgi:rhamnulose-1-phosphate aldolase/alcohol dehydrogenase